MGTVKARQALDENMTRYITATSDPVMWNVCLALKEITKAIDNLEADLTKTKRLVERIASR